VIEASRCARLLLETAQPIVILTEDRRKNFDRDIALQALIASPVDLAHLR
jgi:hypothetical protein